MTDSDSSEQSFEDFMESPHYRPEDANRLYVYRYEHLDDPSFIQSPEQVFSNLKPDALTRLTEAMRKRFLAAGWEGDGSLGLIWLPPFVDVGIEDTWGTYLWHVKQSNNGTSWVGSKYQLDFKRLKEQNEYFPYETHAAVSLVYGAAVRFIEEIVSIQKHTCKRIATLEKIKDSSIPDIKNEILLSAQGELVSLLQEFLDDCYLEILKDVIERGNRSKIRIAKSKVNLNPFAYDIEYEGGLRDSEREEIGKWVTLNGLVRDVWSSFRFEQFPQKVKLLFSACDYEIDEEIQKDVTKHISLRNCVQHHHRSVTADALKHAGVKTFSVLDEKSNSHNLGSGDLIKFSMPELDSFCMNIGKLAASFDVHVRTRIRTIGWVLRKSPETKK